MKENGFTLIELLAVVVLLGVIGLITIPKINNVIKDTNDKSYEFFIKTLEDAAQSYVYLHSSKIDKIIESEDSFIIEINDLVDEGLLKNNLVNPKGYEGYNEIKISKLDGNYEYNLTSNLLPSKYQEVEYIESSGTQYIDSNVISSNTISFESIASINQTVKADGAFCGSRTGINNATRFILWWNNNSGSPKVLMAFGNVESSSKDPQYYEKHKIKFYDKVWYWDDTAVSTFTNEFTNTENLTFCIFGYRNGTNSVDSRRFRGKIYYFKIYDNDILVRNFIPVVRKSDNKPGLYDKVNYVFYENNGTGKFGYEKLDGTYVAPQ